MSAPLKIVECRQIPRSFPVTNAMVEGILERHRTLEQELEVAENISFETTVKTKSQGFL